MSESFSFAATPHIHFGVGKRHELEKVIASFGRRVLLVAGAASFEASGYGQLLLDNLQAQFELRRVRVSGEPSPQLVDDAVARYAGWLPDCVVAIGGGSVIDAAKAIAGLLPSGVSVMEYLEGVGRGSIYNGPSTPFIALPTTAGTGGETSKNAVLSVVGKNGFKKSFRHDLLVARVIILDPELSLGCPPDVTAACGMDALTQLLESYLSSDASPITDALALSGLAHVRESLIPAVEQGDNLEARSGMLYASSISGLTLANAGLGSVHGLASPLGAFFPIPHGVVCGTLVSAAARQNISLLEAMNPLHPALYKYANAGRLMLDDQQLSDKAARTGLLDLLEEWTERLAIARLSAFGISAADIPHITAHASGGMKTNPVQLTDIQAQALLVSRL
ncbi:iron-containing alcohol dehydrogenase [Mariprofundus ferrooxydans]|uniref:iron-containing alcohol dehydrogenase n=1 Tax=Mariprofundus ferrooxydans TaxID=314344 RepID=UPI00036B29B4|nr:iron-containing alcohol dehydrogenase [Mariprofundus ferrooxydans]